MHVRVQVHSTVVHARACTASFYCCACMHVRVQLHCVFSRYHYVGLMVLFFHDIGDVMLEFAKIQVYFKEMGGKKYSFFKVTGDVAFGCFTIQWLVQQACCGRLGFDDNFIVPAVYLYRC